MSLKQLRALEWACYGLAAVCGVLLCRDSVMATESDSCMTQFCKSIDLCVDCHSTATPKQAYTLDKTDCLECAVGRCDRATGDGGIFTNCAGNMGALQRATCDATPRCDCTPWDMTTPDLVEADLSSNRGAWLPFGNRRVCPDES